MYFAAMNNVKFKPVVPGDQLILEMSLISRRNKLCVMSGKAFVDGNMFRSRIYRRCR